QNEEAEGPARKREEEGHTAPNRPALNRWSTAGTRSRCTRSGPLLRHPQPEAAEESILVVSEARLRRKLVDWLGITAPEHYVVGLECRKEKPDDLVHGLVPPLLPEPLATGLADVVLVRALLLVREMPELHGLDDPVDDHRRAEPGAEPEKEHASAV